MKISVVLLLTLTSFFAKGQYDPDTAEVNTIIREIVVPMQNGNTKAVLDRMKFPFTVYGLKDFSRAQMTTEYPKLFTSEMIACFGAYENFQITMPEDKDHLMIVCLDMPEGYGASVLVLEKSAGTWTIEALDLQALEEDLEEDY